MLNQEIEAFGFSESKDHTLHKKPLSTVYNHHASHF